LKASNLTKNIVLADKVMETKVCPSQFEELRWFQTVPDGEGLWISPWSAKHSTIRHYEFDALFVDTSDQVVGICQHFRSYGSSHIYINARGVLELPAGMVERTGTRIGDKIAFEAPAGDGR